MTHLILVSQACAWLHACDAAECTPASGPFMLYCVLYCLYCRTRCCTAHAVQMPGWHCPLREQQLACSRTHALTSLEHPSSK